MHNSNCPLCQTLLTPENTKPGLGMCAGFVVGAEPPWPKRPPLFILYVLVCTDCASRAKELDNADRIFVFEDSECEEFYAVIEPVRLERASRQTASGDVFRYSHLESVDQEESGIPV